MGAGPNDQIYLGAGNDALYSYGGFGADALYAGGYGIDFFSVHQVGTQQIDLTDLDWSGFEHLELLDEMGNFWASARINADDLDMLRSVTATELWVAGPGRASLRGTELTFGTINLATGGAFIDLAGVISNFDMIVEGSSGADSVSGSTKNDTLNGNDGNDRLIGGAGNDILDGGNGIDVLDGSSGADTMTGGAGGDLYFVDNLNDRVIELAGGGVDTIKAVVGFWLPANVERLTLIGTRSITGVGNFLDNVMIANDAGNQLNGAGGNDNLIGGAGVDSFLGGTGTDIFYGGASGDRFAFREGEFGATLSLGDRIRDFSHDEGDRIDLSDIDADRTRGGNQAFKFIGTNRYSGAAGELRYQYRGNETLIVADLDGDRMNDLVIRLDGLHDLIGADFRL